MTSRLISEKDIANNQVMHIIAAQFHEPKFISNKQQKWMMLIIQKISIHQEKTNQNHTTKQIWFCTRHNNLSLTQSNNK